MSGRRIFAALAAAGLAALLDGCSYDYLQHTDRIGYRAGDAVKANLAQETTNPSKRSMYSTKGIGRNGYVSTTGVPATPPATAAAAAPAPAPIPTAE